MNVDPALESILPSFTTSLENAFNSMVMLPVNVGPLEEKKSGNPIGCISGTIGLSGTHTESNRELRTQISLIFSEELATRIFRSMMMMEPDMPVEAEELHDVVGELANMTAGGTKTILSEKGFLLSLSLPSVAVGKDHYLSTPSGSGLSVVAPVKIDDETFYMEISASFS